MKENFMLMERVVGKDRVCCFWRSEKTFYEKELCLAAFPSFADTLRRKRKKPYSRIGRLHKQPWLGYSLPGRG